MTIDELVAVLGEIRAKHGNVVVLLASDAEGNSYTPICADYALGVFELGEFCDQDDCWEDDEGKLADINAIAFFPL